MVKLRIFLVLFMLLSRQGAWATTEPVDTVLQVKTGRVLLLSGAASLTMVGTYLYLQNVWWSDQKSSFKFDHDMDYRYAKNMDKAAHFIGGCLSADLFSEGFMWTGLPERKSLFWGGVAGTAIQGMIEVKDGYAPTYGFSLGDLGAGTLGSFWPLLKSYVPALKPITIKASYYQHNRYYYEVFPYAEPVDDYMNQTYWLSATVNDWLPKGSRAERLWPDFLTVAGGWGVDNTLNLYYTGQNLEVNKGRGKYEYFLSVDIDWRKIIKPTNTFKRTLAYSLNFIKLPLPTLRLGPTMQGYWAYW